MLAGDYCGIAGGELRVTVREKYDANSYRAQADAYLKALPPKKSSNNWQPIDKQRFISSLNDKVGRIAERLKNIIRIDLLYLGERSRIEIDCFHHTARWVEEFSEGTPYHHFTLDLIASAAWLNGCRFEEVIGMRRFKLRREPNVYSKAVLRLTSTAF